MERTVPAWVRDEMEVTAHWVRAIQTEPKLWLRARLGQGEALAKRLGQTGGVSTTSDPVSLPDAVLYEGDEDLFRTPEFHAGEFEIQDIASQAVGVLCDPQPGETWWDACAGEGGKTLHLSDLMRNKGLIWASDRSAPRIQSFKRRAARAKCFNYRAAPWDGGAKLPTKTKFDGVLLDAPCSGLGTWQRNPHARWTTTPQDVRELAEVQKNLLLHAAAGVKPGGKLIYAACTLTRAETSGVVDWFNGQASGLEPLALPVSAAPSQPTPASATITLLPQEFGGNGMFIAAWRKSATAGV
ncbi:MAG: RsmB/NOP family class I SAM-dependent RNA methyltransferase [Pedosphaera parvula]|nr:RsmB/NOP family class I SAM-dependent RNA methyltransferase [Pedosphaera parvula]